jgi:pilus assembly protein TadC
VIVTAMFAGALVGLGCWFLVRAFAAPAPSLHQDLLELHRPRWPEAAAPISTGERLRRHVLRIAAPTVAGLGADLELMERDEDRFVLERCMAACAFAALPVLFTAVVALGSVAVAPLVAVIAALALGTVGFFVPVVLLRSDARRRRQDARLALGAYLDVVTILLAGGKGPTSALAEAASAGDGWFFARLRRAMESTASAGTPIWDEIARLGERLELPDLYEFAMSITLAGTAGAGVRETLLAKAETVRMKSLAEAEAEANHDSELLVIPTVALLVAFVLLLGFPAAYQIIGF